MSLKNKTISGLKWSFTDTLANQIVQFVIGLVLARLLSPGEYGIIGMAMVFIAISETFVDSGLSQALIRKQDCSEEDYNTMFYTNIGIGIVTFLIIFFSAGAISRFYKNEDLFTLTRVMAVNLIIGSFGMVETAMLVKQIDFKRQTKISVISSVSSGVIGIVLAFLGFGYWSLAIRTLCHNLFKVVMLHLSSSWRPRLIYSVKSFKEMFGFGSKLLVAELITSIYNNIYKLVIGARFSAEELGYYSRAEQFKNLPSKNLQVATQRVTYPVLSGINDDASLKRAMQKIIKLMFYITCTLMLLLIVNSKEVILVLIGPKWEPAIPYLRIVCISGMFAPLHSINLNLLKVKGRSDITLRLEIIKRLLEIPAIIIGIRFGMIALLWGMVANAFVGYLINAWYTSKLIDYSVFEQLKDLSLTSLNTLVMAGVAFVVTSFLPTGLIVSFIIKNAFIVAYVFISGNLFKIDEYMELKRLAGEQARIIFLQLKGSFAKNRQ